MGTADSKAQRFIRLSKHTSPAICLQGIMQGSLCTGSEYDWPVGPLIDRNSVDTASEASGVRDSYFSPCFCSFARSFYIELEEATHITLVSRLLSE